MVIHVSFAGVAIPEVMNNNFRASTRPERRPAVQAFDPHFAPSKSFDDALFGDMRQTTPPRRAVAMPHPAVGAHGLAAGVAPRQG